MIIKPRDEFNIFIPSCKADSSERSAGWCIWVWWEFPRRYGGCLCVCRTKGRTHLNFNLFRPQRCPPPLFKRRYLVFLPFFWIFVITSWSTESNKNCFIVFSSLLLLGNILSAHVETNLIQLHIEISKGNKLKKHFQQHSSLQSKEKCERKTSRQDDERSDRKKANKMSKGFFLFSFLLGCRVNNLWYANHCTENILLRLFKPIRRIHENC